MASYETLNSYDFFKTFLLSRPLPLVQFQMRDNLLCHVVSSVLAGTVATSMYRPICPVFIVCSFIITPFPAVCAPADVLKSRLMSAVSPSIWPPDQASHWHSVLLLVIVVICALWLSPLIPVGESEPRRNPQAIPSERRAKLLVQRMDTRIYSVRTEYGPHVCIFWGTSIFVPVSATARMGLY